MITDHEVLVVGGGPVGLMLAAELALAGVDVAVLERRTTPDLTIKAGAISGAAVAALDRRGLLDDARAAQDRMMAAISQGSATLRRPPGPPVGGHLAAIPLRLDLIDMPTSEHTPIPFLLAVPQHELESILRARVESLGVPVHRGVTVRDIHQDTDGVVVTARERWSARWLVGADGGRSVIRTMSGIAFPGTAGEITGRQALVDLAGTEELEAGWHHTPSGVYCLGPVPGRILTVEFDGPPADRESPVTAAELQASLRRTTGSDDVRVGAVHSATRWTDNARLTAAYRHGRVLLAGDAAHVHPPFGGQGLGLGLGDAMNLGWKLAAVVTGGKDDALLDTYDPERRPAAVDVLELTRAQVALMRTDEKTRALRRLAEQVLATRAGVSAVARRLAGVDAAVPIAGHDDGQVGRLAPELTLTDGRRLAEAARDGRCTLVGPDDAVLAAGAGYDVTTARADEAMLVRPDGVVAWTGAGSPAAALARWCPVLTRRARVAS